MHLVTLNSSRAMWFVNACIWFVLPAASPTLAANLMMYLHACYMERRLDWRSLFRSGGVGITGRSFCPSPELVA
jgi:hypothetical protein